MKNIIAFLLLLPAQLIFSAELNPVVVGQGRDRCEKLWSAVEAEGFDRNSFTIDSSDGFVSLVNRETSEIVWKSPEVYLSESIPNREIGRVIGRAICAHQLKHHPQRLVRKRARRQKTIYAVATGLCISAAGIGAMVYGAKSRTDKARHSNIAIRSGVLLSGIGAPLTTILMLPLDIRSTSEVELSYAHHQAQQQSDEVKDKKLKAVHKRYGDKTYKEACRFVLKSEFDFEAMTHLNRAYDCSFLRQIDAEILTREAQSNSSGDSLIVILINRECGRNRLEEPELKAISDSDAEVPYKVGLLSLILYARVISSLIGEKEDSKLDKFKCLTLGDLIQSKSC